MKLRHTALAACLALGLSASVFAASPAEDGLMAYQLGDYAKAAPLLEKAAENNAKAQLALGDMYRYGTGVAKDEKKALELFRKSAKSGNTDATIALASLYLDGGEGIRDGKKSAELLSKLADTGNVEANMLLGIMHLQGRYVPQDEKKAEGYLKKAAAAENMDAIVFLSSLYYRQKRYDEAIPWLESGAVRGDVDCQEMLYRIHHGKTELPKAKAK